MQTKEAVLLRLEECRGCFVSGGELALGLSVSRNAVWKAVGLLRAEGYSISSVSNRGYRLDADDDTVSAAGISRYIPDDIPSKVFFMKETGSTNDIIKSKAALGADEWTVVVTARQTSGRGRMGRSFVSPPGGLYMSILLRPGLSAESSLMITTAAAVAAAETIERISGKTAGIKWVNDVYIGEKKVCGILTEASVNLEDGGLEYAVVGVGVNVSTPAEAFPEDLRERAGSIFPDGSPADAANRIAAGIITGMYRLCTRLEPESFLPEYRRRSIMPGRRITVISGNGTAAARAVGINDDFSLGVIYDDGTTASLYSGDVSIKV